MNGNRMHKIRAALLALIAAASFLCACASCKEGMGREFSTPEEMVREFYTWYGAREAANELAAPGDRVSPIEDDEILRYVDPCVAGRLRVTLERSYFDYIYFTGGNDWWPELHQDFYVGKAVPAGKEVSIIPVGLNFFGDVSPDLLVFVRKGKDGWRIIKVEGAR